MSTQQPESSALPSADNPTRTIACVICRAAYSPSRWYEHLLLAPPIALESAFMGMCHFCFRCRRPACPQCWDDVHGICAQCGEESRLPFRRATAPLSPLLFTSARQAQSERVQPATVPFICLMPGKFHSAHPHAVEEMSTAAMQAITHEKARGPEKQHNTQTREKSNMPSQEQGAVQRPEPKAGGQSAPVEIDEMQTRPGRTNRLSRRLERFFTLLLCVILVLVILCVAAAYLSEDANTFISSTLHVDIRAEIAYLWQLITHLF